ncbi:50S ribosomal protein L18 [Candidatus Aminicenantes bacterium AC-334-K16]|nr:50S ribosomal protein L18 [Candidatus Aminicenantes bacterium AC-334-K16]
MFKDKVELKKKSREKIRKRIRKKIRGTPERPRVFIYQSNRYIYTQVVDDVSGRVLFGASTLEKSFREKMTNTKNIKAAEELGKILAQRLKERKLEKIVFDRGAYPYHGRVKAIAESLRQEGIIF